MAASESGRAGTAKDPLLSYKEVHAKVPTLSGLAVSTSMPADTVAASKEPLRHGEIEFEEMGGHRCRYLVVPEALHEPGPVLNHMFLDPKGWRLTPPSLIMEGAGGRNHYCNWKLEVDDLSGWGHDGEADFKRMRRFDSRIQEIAASICQAASECQGWLDFEEGGRSGFSELLSDGLKVHWKTHRTLAGHKSDIVAFGIRDLSDPKYDKLEFLDQMKENTVEVGKRTEKVVHYPSVGAQLFPEVYGGPPLSSTIAKVSGESSGGPLAAIEEDGAGSEKEGASVAVSAWKDTATLQERMSHVAFKKYILPASTHFIFTGNKHLTARLKLALENLATRALVAANGPMKFVIPGPDAILTNGAAKGVPVVLLHHTGGAAEAFAAAVKRRVKGEKQDGHIYELPDNVPESSVIILNTAEDSAERVIDKLTTVLSSSRDEEDREVGNALAERKRLEYAWDTYTVYQHNAVLQWSVAARLQYTIMLLTLGTTVTTLGADFLAQQAKLAGAGAGAGACLNDEKCWAFLEVLTSSEALQWIQVVVVCLPLVSGFFLQVNNRFNPVTKWAYLEHARIAIESEIYKFRSRTQGYGAIATRKQKAYRLMQNIVIQDKFVTGLRPDWKPPPQGPSTTLGATGDRQPAVPKGGAGEEAEADEDMDTNLKVPGRRTRRQRFAEAMGHISNSVLSSELNTEALKQPPANALREKLRSLYNSEMESQRLKRAGASCWSCWTREGYTCLGNHDEIAKAEGNSDFRAIIHAKDEFMKDDGVSPTTPEDYLNFRMLPMLHAYMHRVAVLSFWQNVAQVLIFLLSATATALSTFKCLLIVPMVIAVMSTLQSLLSFLNMSACIRNLNNSVLTLKSLRIWWQSLSMVETRMPSNFDYLVEVTESCVDAEVSTWVKSTATVKKNPGEDKGEGDDQKADEDDTAK